MSMRFAFFPARDDVGGMRAYLDEVLAPAFLIPAEARLLFRFTEELLLSSDAIIGLALNGEAVAGGFHISIDGNGDAYLKGLRVASNYRGMQVGSFMVENALRHIRNRAVHCCKLVVRCDNEGQPSQPASLLYLKHNFQNDGSLVSVGVSGEPVDAHLGSPGTRFLVQPMVFHFGGVY